MNKITNCSIIAMLSIFIFSACSKFGNDCGSITVDYVYADTYATWSSDLNDLYHHNYPIAFEYDSTLFALKGTFYSVDGQHRISLLVPFSNGVYSNATTTFSSDCKATPQPCEITYQFAVPMVKYAILDSTSHYDCWFLKTMSCHITNLTTSEDNGSLVSMIVDADLYNYSDYIATDSLGIWNPSIFDLNKVLSIQVHIDNFPIER